MGVFQARWLNRNPESASPTKGPVGPEFRRWGPEIGAAGEKMGTSPTRWTRGKGGAMLQ